MQKPVTVEINKHDFISLLCYRRDSYLSYYVKTLMPGWHEVDVIDVDKYREGILQQVKKDEDYRASLVGQQPHRVEDLLEQKKRAFKDPKWGQVYNQGLPIPN